MTRFTDPSPGVRCLVQLSEAGGNRFLDAAEIARCEGMELALVREILEKLTRAGLIETSGAAGGFRLARSESAIQVRDIQRALTEGAEPDRGQVYGATLAELLAFESLAFEDESAARAS
jgi:DNA-binding IscR family transcriptional regulator